MAVRQPRPQLWQTLPAEQIKNARKKQNTNKPELQFVLIYDHFQFDFYF